MPGTPLPVSYPFVHYKSDAMKVDGVDTRIFGKDKACIIDSLWASSQSAQNLLLNLYIIKNAETEAVKVPLITKRAFTAYAAFELLPDSVLYIEAGDLVFAFTDFSDNQVALTLSYRQLTNQT